MLPIIKELESRDIFFDTCNTGQHKQMVDDLINIFDVKVDIDLKIMTERQSLFDIGTKILRSMKDVLSLNNYDYVLVHGDTSTAFYSSLAAFYLKIPVIHIEAGLRTGDMDNPFPEEFNRKSIDSISSLMFCPTDGNKLNLIKEGIPSEKIFVTGNTIVDSIKLTYRKDYNNKLIEWLGDSRLILVTVHRRENVPENLDQIFIALNKIITNIPDIKVIYPIHLNPQIIEIAEQVIERSDRISLVAPLNVIDFHNIIARSHLILTDSGGIQEEAPTFGVPVLVLRKITERPEAVEIGTAKVIGTKSDDIYNEVDNLINDNVAYSKMVSDKNPFGDGQSSKRIVDIILNHYNEKSYINS
jgi:UDP-N-acetylglucosamine 2-epimerase (non-hydrolysing)